MKYRVMNIDDYNHVIKLWQDSEGIKLREADSYSGIKKYLIRNPNLSFVAIDEFNNIIGTIMAGHDGKRGYLQHLIIHHNYQKRGIATKLLLKCLKALKNEGIIKSHIHVLNINESGKEFWRKKGWIEREDIQTYSFINGKLKNS